MSKSRRKRCLRTPLPNQSYLQDRLDYNPITGELVWKIKYYRINPGDRAGTLAKNGRWTVRIDKKLYQRGRIIYRLMTGLEPDEIDHRNRDTTIETWINLRDATHEENLQNRHLTVVSKSGYRGVRRFGKRYRAAIKKGKKSHTIGWFDTAEEAADAYIAASNVMYGEFAYNGQA